MSLARFVKKIKEEVIWHIKNSLLKINQVVYS